MIDILSEEFVIPDHHMDLSDLIDESWDYYLTLKKNTIEAKKIKNKINQLVDVYNEKRKQLGEKKNILNHLK